MTTTADLTRYLDSALAATVELPGMLRLAGATAELVEVADDLDSAVLALSEAELCGEHGRRFVHGLRSAAGQAGRLVEALASVEGAGLPLVLARLDADEVRAALLLAMGAV